MTFPEPQSLWKLKMFLLYPESHPGMCLLSFPCSFVIYFPCCCELVWHYRNGAGWIILRVGFSSLFFHTVLKSGGIRQRWDSVDREGRRRQKLSQFVGKVFEIPFICSLSISESQQRHVGIPDPFYLVSAPAVPSVGRLCGCTLLTTGGWSPKQQQIHFSYYQHNPIFPNCWFFFFVIL